MLRLYPLYLGAQAVHPYKEKIIRHIVNVLLVVPDVSVHVHLDTCEQGADHVGTLLLQFTAVQCTRVTVTEQ